MCNHNQQIMANKKIKHQAHGKVEKFVPTTLDQLLGDDGTGKYSTMEEQVYANRLKEMNKADLQHECIKIGLIPVDSRDVMVKRLMAQFNKHVSQYRIPERNKENDPKTIESATKEFFK